MLHNYLIVAFRNLLKQRGFTLINVLGLAVGMTAFILMTLYVADEVSFDRYNEHADRIFRVAIERKENASTESRFWTAVSPGYGPALKKEFPAIEQSVRFWMWGTFVISNGEKTFVEDRLALAEPSVFSIFSFPLDAGDRSKVLNDPFSAVLTRTAAEKYFGTQDVLGRKLSVRTSRGSQEVLVTGVMQDVPRNSHVSFDVLVSFSSWERISGSDLTFLGGDYNYPTYVLLTENASVDELRSQLPDFIGRNISSTPERDARDAHRVHLEPLLDVYLSGLSDAGYGPTGNIETVRASAVIAFLIMFIACVNFVNVSTARSMRRSREVGLRKVFGAYRTHLVAQFLGESLLVTAASLVIAVAAVETLLPGFNDFLVKDLSFSLFDHAWLIAVILLVVGALAGGYPAFVLSAFRPAGVLKGETSGGTRATRLRAGLVVLQFTISIALITAVIVIQAQMSFVRAKQLGFEKAQLVTFPLSGRSTMGTTTMLERLRNIPGVVSASASSRVPSGILNDALNASVEHDGQPTPAGFRLPYVAVEHDFVRTYGMTIVAGRDFSRSFGTDTAGGSFILNETAVRRLGWAQAAEAIGTEMTYGRFTGRVIGVVKDFHFESLHEEIKPMLLLIAPFERIVTARLDPNRVQDALASVEALWKDARPDFEFSYSFFDERFAQAYAEDMRAGEIVSAFSGIALFIACLGLFGLAAHASERRTKEFGVRKVLGASGVGIAGLLSKEFALLIVIASVLAVPVSAWGMNMWLQNFAYRIGLSWWMFVVPTIIAIVISMLTIGSQAWKAAGRNPVESLRYE